MIGSRFASCLWAVAALWVAGTALWSYPALREEVEEKRYLARVAKRQLPVIPVDCAGAAKPDPRLFDAALELAGSSPDRALYVGDSPANDVDGAAAAGIRTVLLRRAGERLDRVPADSAATRAAPVAEIERLDQLARVL